MKHFSFPSIVQFRNIVSDSKKIQQQEKLKGDFIIEFEGSVKLHGSNGGIILTKDGDFYAQSRTNVLSIQKDNCGFAAFIENPEVKNFIKPILQELLDKSDFYSDGLKNFYAIGLFGEVAGKGIQKSVGINEMPQFFAPFALYLFEYSQDANKEIERTPLPTELLNKFLNEALRIFPVTAIPNCTFKKSINLTNDLELGKVSNELGELTAQVEQECPFAKHFGISGVGEGIVWKNSAGISIKGEKNSFYIKPHQLMFKVKGEKHSVSKVKTLAAVDVEKLEKIQDFVDYALTENRLKQGINHLKEQHLDLVSENVGSFIKWIHEDVIKEESDVLTGNNLNWKDVVKKISIQSREWFFNYYEE